MINIKLYLIYLHILNVFLAIKRLIILASYITALEKLDECKLKILKKNITGSRTKKKKEIIMRLKTVNSFFL